MKNFLVFSLLALIFTFAFCDNAYAQKKKKKSSDTDEYFDESGFVNKLWFGGNFTLGFAGGDFQSQFVFGVSPMVGYKLVGDMVSIGPRVGIEYNHIRLKLCSQCEIEKISPISYSLGVFTRIKPFQNFFGHFEYEYENAAYGDFNQNGDLITIREKFDNVYVGAGYHSGGSLWGYEILLLYNVNQPDYLVASPFDIRFGITYKF